MRDARAFRTTIALKFLMTASGLVFIGYVLAHMYGNLKAFSGEAAFNEYAHHIRELGEPLLPHEGFLWLMRVLLVVALVVHVWSGFALWRKAAKARPVKYAVKKHTGAIPAARIMRLAGVWVLGFTIWHLLNFTIVKVNPSNGETGGDNPYALLVDSFDLWWMTLIYLVSMAFLGAHLHHGTWSSLQTLGWTSTAPARARAKAFALGFAIVVAGGFSLVPLGVLVGIID
ncbi:succinate dehydrogenase cytochrome b subunit [Nocardioides sp. TF02-7]|uniref:succinate dehydrogenase cytochrome b subunit n=1 Tax=Nocardioides sp. TF02-7 TaxID=2917724 RepID=UPI001F06E8D8|nr:succinate dehydrogenase cytochrome b subunit [Nocardioides sp. TF02-7]UMG93333.1 succinate dehydrogenase cytochrome b subunit [Nocardioides sp. TF02-7]